MLSRLECRFKFSVDPPRFDGTLLQSGMGCDVWRVAIASMLLCRTRRVQAEPVLRELLLRWPDAPSLCRAETYALEAIVRPCGLQRNRARQLSRFSCSYLGDSWGYFHELPGVGVYVTDAVAVFCFNSREVRSGDHALAAYVETRMLDQQAEGPRPVGVYDGGS